VAVDQVDRKSARPLENPFVTRYSFCTPVLKIAVATITRTPSNTWKAFIHKRGWPVTVKTSRTERDAGSWLGATVRHTDLPQHPDSRTP
jgi:hypothetical protein